MIGNRAYDVHDRRRFALYLMNNILGGPGMNARLNIALREKHGLVYTVDSLDGELFGHRPVVCLLRLRPTRREEMPPPRHARA